MQPHWHLCNDHAAYQFSFAIFYEQGVDEFTHFQKYLTGRWCSVGTPTTEANAIASYGFNFYFYVAEPFNITKTFFMDQFMPASFLIRRIAYSKAIIVMMLLAGLLPACKKVSNYNKSSMHAEVVISTGETINIDATGSLFRMSCIEELFGIPLGPYIEGKTSANSGIYINVTGPCFKSPVTVLCTITFKKDELNPAAAVFVGQGSVTVVTIKNDYMEGTFKAVCKCYTGDCVAAVDQANVSGTFKKYNL